MAEPEIVEIEPQTTAVIGGIIPVGDLTTFFDRAFSRLPGILADQGVSPIGAAFAWYEEPPLDTVDIQVGFPTDRAIETAGDVVAARLPGGRVARLVHEGSFDGRGDSGSRLMGWVIGNGHQPTGGFWEVYLTEPSPDMDPATLRTELNCPLAPEPDGRPRGA